jgi:hypothetical protein
MIDWTDDDYPRKLREFIDPLALNEFGTFLWSRRPVGLAPTGKRRLSTAHTQSGHSAGRA